ncbi:MAG TPA: hypothetical protein VNL91_07340, partial [Thermoanaerobaculia bacterium]|nr:hypothetical protein [Thermoanaerobaculia bacterium]
MRPFRWVLTLALLAGSAVAQTLDCPGGAGAVRPCEAFHFHVSLYRPDTRGMTELWGVNQFASQAACERAREAWVRKNAAVVDYYRKTKNDQRYEPDRFGLCHCDMTNDKANARYLTPQARTAQLRQLEEIRMRVRERLLDSGMKSDSDLARSLLPQPMDPNPLIGGAKLLLPLPAVSAQIQTDAAADLKTTRAIDTSRAAPPSFDLPLVEIPITISAELRAQPPPLPSVSVAPPSTAAPEPLPAPAPVEQTTADAAPAPAEGGAEYEDSAAAFIATESERLRNILTASRAITDETISAQIHEAVQHRNRLLSNLRGLIEGSGFRSRLAAAVREAKGESG